MWNEPTKEQLDKLPKLYETDGPTTKDKIIHMHFFIGGCDWYISEYDGEDIFFGFAILNDDYMCAEWGYISFHELKTLKFSGIEVDNDLYWEPKPAEQVEKIVKGGGVW